MVTKPHEDLYHEFQEWIAQKDGVNDSRDVAEAIGSNVRVVDRGVTS